MHSHIGAHHIGSLRSWNVVWPQDLLVRHRALSEGQLTRPHLSVERGGEFHVGYIPIGGML